MTHDWSTFTLSIPVRASLADLYLAWATKKGIESWFLRSAEFVNEHGLPRGADETFQRGDRYSWYWHGYPDDVFEKKSILDANGSDKLSFVFSGDCLVTVELKQQEGFVMVALTQSKIPTDEQGKLNLYFGCGTGWTFYLANLKSVMEGGLDLRNRDEALKNVVSS